MIEKLDKPKHKGGIFVLRSAATNQHGEAAVEADGKILVSQPALKPAFPRKPDAIGLLFLCVSTR